MEKFRRRKIRELLPWYLNGTLDPRERNAVEKCLHNEDQIITELEEWRAYQALVKILPQQKPSKVVLSRIKYNLQSQRLMFQVIPSWLSWIMGGVLALVLFLVFWISLQPGLVLQWTVLGNIPEVFQIYRIKPKSGEYRLIGEIEANPEIINYKYTDSPILFSGEYQYKIEGLYNSENQILQESISVSMTNILIDQVIIVIISILFGIIVSVMLQTLPIKYSIVGNAINI